MPARVSKSKIKNQKLKFNTSNKVGVVLGEDSVNSHGTPLLLQKEPSSQISSLNSQVSEPSLIPLLSSLFSSVIIGLFLSFGILAFLTSFFPQLIRLPQIAEIFQTCTHNCGGPSPSNPPPPPPPPLGGSSGGSCSGACGCFASCSDWEQAYKNEHGTWPDGSTGAQPNRDSQAYKDRQYEAQVSGQFASQTGHSPTQQDWEDRYNNGGWDFESKPLGGAIGTATGPLIVADACALHSGDSGNYANCAQAVTQCGRSCVEINAQGQVVSIKWGETTTYGKIFDLAQNTADTLSNYSQYIMTKCSESGLSDCNSPEAAATAYDTRWNGDPTKDLNLTENLQQAKTMDAFLQATKTVTGGGDGSTPQQEALAAAILNQDRTAPAAIQLNAQAYAACQVTAGCTDPNNLTAAQIAAAQANAEYAKFLAAYIEVLVVQQANKIPAYANLTYIPDILKPPPPQGTQTQTGPTIGGKPSKTATVNGTQINLQQCGENVCATDLQGTIISILGKGTLTDIQVLPDAEAAKLAKATQVFNSLVTYENGQLVVDKAAINSGFYIVQGDPVKTADGQWLINLVAPGSKNNIIHQVSLSDIAGAAAIGSAPTNVNTVLSEDLINKLQTGEKIYNTFTYISKEDGGTLAQYRLNVTPGTKVYTVDTNGKTIETNLYTEQVVPLLNTIKTSLTQSGLSYSNPADGGFQSISVDTTNTKVNIGVKSTTPIVHTISDQQINPTTNQVDAAVVQKIKTFDTNYNNLVQQSTSGTQINNNSSQYQQITQQLNAQGFDVKEIKLDPNGQVIVVTQQRGGILESQLSYNINSFETNGALTAQTVAQIQANNQVAAQLQTSTQALQDYIRNSSGQNLLVDKVQTVNGQVIVTVKSADGRGDPQGYQFNAVDVMNSQGLAPAQYYSTVNQINQFDRFISYDPNNDTYSLKPLTQADNDYLNNLAKIEYNPDGSVKQDAVSGYNIVSKTVEDGKLVLAVEAADGKGTIQKIDGSAFVAQGGFTAAQLTQLRDTDIAFYNAQQKYVQLVTTNVNDPTQLKYTFKPDANGNTADKIIDQDVRQDSNGLYRARVTLDEKTGEIKVEIIRTDGQPYALTHQVDGALLLTQGLTPQMIQEFQNADMAAFNTNNQLLNINGSSQGIAYSVKSSAAQTLNTYLPAGYKINQNEIQVNPSTGQLIVRVVSTDPAKATSVYTTFDGNQLLQNRGLSAQALTELNAKNQQYEAQKNLVGEQVINPGQPTQAVVNQTNANQLKQSLENQLGPGYTVTVTVDSQGKPVITANYRGVSSRTIDPAQLQTNGTLSAAQASQMRTADQNAYDLFRAQTNEVLVNPGQPTVNVINQQAVQQTVQQQLGNGYTATNTQIIKDANGVTKVVTDIRSNTNANVVVSQVDTAALTTSTSYKQQVQTSIADQQRLYTQVAKPSASGFDLGTTNVLTQSVQQQLQQKLNDQLKRTGTTAVVSSNPTTGTTVTYSGQGDYQAQKQYTGEEIVNILNKGLSAQEATAISTGSQIAVRQQALQQPQERVAILDNWYNSTASNQIGDVFDLNGERYVVVSTKQNCSGVGSQSCTTIVDQVKKIVNGQLVGNAITVDTNINLFDRIARTTDKLYVDDLSAVVNASNPDQQLNIAQKGTISGTPVIPATIPTIATAKEVTTQLISLSNNTQGISIDSIAPGAVLVKDGQKFAILSQNGYTLQLQSLDHPSDPSISYTIAQKNASDYMNTGAPIIQQGWSILADTSGKPLTLTLPTSPTQKITDLNSNAVLLLDVKGPSYTKDLFFGGTNVNTTPANPIPIFYSPTYATQTLNSNLVAEYALSQGFQYQFDKDNKLIQTPEEFLKAKADTQFSYNGLSLDLNKANLGLTNAQIQQEFERRGTTQKINIDYFVQAKQAGLDIDLNQLDPTTVTQSQEYRDAATKYLSDQLFTLEGAGALISSFANPFDKPVRIIQDLGGIFQGQSFATSINNALRTTLNIDTIANLAIGGDAIFGSDNSFTNLYLTNEAGNSATSIIKWVSNAAGGPHLLVAENTSYGKAALFQQNLAKTLPLLQTNGITPDFSKSLYDQPKEVQELVTLTSIATNKQIAGLEKERAISVGELTVEAAAAILTSGASSFAQKALITAEKVAAAPSRFALVSNLINTSKGVHDTVAVIARADDILLSGRLLTNAAGKGLSYLDLVGAAATGFGGATGRYMVQNDAYEAANDYCQTQGCTDLGKQYITSFQPSITDVITQGALSVGLGAAAGKLLGNEMISGQLVDQFTTYKTPTLAQAFDSTLLAQIDPNTQYANNVLIEFGKKYTPELNVLKAKGASQTEINAFIQDQLQVDVDIYERALNGVNSANIQTSVVSTRIDTLANSLANTISKSTVATAIQQFSQSQDNSRPILGTEQDIQQVKHSMASKLGISNPNDIQIQTTKDADGLVNTFNITFNRNTVELVALKGQPIPDGSNVAAQGIKLEPKLGNQISGRVENGRLVFDVDPNTLHVASGDYLQAAQNVKIKLGEYGQKVDLEAPMIISPDNPAMADAVPQATTLLNRITQTVTGTPESKLAKSVISEVELKYKPELDNLRAQGATQSQLNDFIQTKVDTDPSLITSAFKNTTVDPANVYVADLNKAINLETGKLAQQIIERNTPPTGLAALNPFGTRAPPASLSTQADSVIKNTSTPEEAVTQLKNLDPTIKTADDQLASSIDTYKQAQKAVDEAQLQVTAKQQAYDTQAEALQTKIQQQATNPDPALEQQIAADQAVLKQAKAELDQTEAAYRQTLTTLNQARDTLATATQPSQPTFAQRLADAFGVGTSKPKVDATDLAATYRQGLEAGDATAARQELDTLNSGRVTQAATDLETSATQVKGLTQEKTAAETQLAKDQAQLDQVKTNRAQVANEVQQGNAQLKIYQEALKRFDNEPNLSQQRINIGGEPTDITRSNINGLETQVRNLQTQNPIRTQNLAALDRQIADLEKAIPAQQQQVAKLASDLATAQQATSKAQQTLAQVISDSQPNWWQRLTNQQTQTNTQVLTAIRGQDSVSQVSVAFKQGDGLVQFDPKTNPKRPFVPTDKTPASLKQAINEVNDIAEAIADHMGYPSLREFQNTGMLQVNARVSQGQNILNQQGAGSGKATIDRLFGLMRAKQGKVVVHHLPGPAAVEDVLGTILKNKGPKNAFTDIPVFTVEKEGFFQVKLGADGSFDRIPIKTAEEFDALVGKGALGVTDMDQSAFNYSAAKKYLACTTADSAPTQPFISTAYALSCSPNPEDLLKVHYKDIIDRGGHTIDEGHLYPDKQWVTQDPEFIIKLDALDNLTPEKALEVKQAFYNLELAKVQQIVDDTVGLTNADGLASLQTFRRQAQTLQAQGISVRDRLFDPTGKLLDQNLYKQTYQEAIEKQFAQSTGVSKRYLEQALNELKGATSAPQVDTVLAKYFKKAGFEDELKGSISELTIRFQAIENVWRTRSKVFGVDIGIDPESGLSTAMYRQRITSEKPSSVIDIVLQDKEVMRMNQELGNIGFEPKDIQFQNYALNLSQNKVTFQEMFGPKAGKDGNFISTATGSEIAAQTGTEVIGDLDIKFAPKKDTVLAITPRDRAEKAVAAAQLSADQSAFGVGADSGIDFTVQEDEFVRALWNSKTSQGHPTPKYFLLATEEDYLIYPIKNGQIDRTTEIFRTNDLNQWQAQFLNLNGGKLDPAIGYQMIDPADPSAKIVLADNQFASYSHRIQQLDRVIPPKEVPILFTDVTDTATTLAQGPARHRAFAAQRAIQNHPSYVALKNDPAGFSDSEIIAQLKLQGNPHFEEYRAMGYTDDQIEEILNIKYVQATRVVETGYVAGNGTYIDPKILQGKTADQVSIQLQTDAPLVNTTIYHQVGPETYQIAYDATTKQAQATLLTNDNIDQIVFQNNLNQQLAAKRVKGTIERINLAELDLMNQAYKQARQQIESSWLPIGKQSKLSQVDDLYAAALAEKNRTTQVQSLSFAQDITNGQTSIYTAAADVQLRLKLFETELANLNTSQRLGLNLTAIKQTLGTDQELMPRSNFLDAFELTADLKVPTSGQPQTMGDFLDWTLASYKKSDLAQAYVGASRSLDPANVQINTKAAPILEAIDTLAADPGNATARQGVAEAVIAINPKASAVEVEAAVASLVNNYTLLQGGANSEPEAEQARQQIAQAERELVSIALPITAQQQLGQKQAQLNAYQAQAEQFRNIPEASLVTSASRTLPTGEYFLSPDGSAAKAWTVRKESGSENTFTLISPDGSQQFTISPNNPRVDVPPTANEHVVIELKNNQITISNVTPLDQRNQILASLDQQIAGLQGDIDSLKTQIANEAKPPSGVDLAQVPVIGNWLANNLPTWLGGNTKPPISPNTITEDRSPQRAQILDNAQEAIKASEAIIIPLNMPIQNEDLEAEYLALSNQLQANQQYLDAIRAEGQNSNFDEAQAEDDLLATQIARIQDRVTALEQEAQTRNLALNPVTPVQAQPNNPYAGENQGFPNPLATLGNSLRALFTGGTSQPTQLESPLNQDLTQANAALAKLDNDIQSTRQDITKQEQLIKDTQNALKNTPQGNLTGDEEARKAGLESTLAAAKQELEDARKALADFEAQRPELQAAADQALIAVNQHAAAQIAQTAQSPNPFRAAWDWLTLAETRQQIRDYFFGRPPTQPVAPTQTITLAQARTTSTARILDMTQQLNGIDVNNSEATDVLAETLDTAITAQQALINQIQAISGGSTQLEQNRLQTIQQLNRDLAQLQTLETQLTEKIAAAAETIAKEQETAQATIEKYTAEANPIGLNGTALYNHLTVTRNNIQVLLDNSDDPAAKHRQSDLEAILTGIDQTIAEMAAARRTQYAESNQLLQETESLLAQAQAADLAQAQNLIINLKQHQEDLINSIETLTELQTLDQNILDEIGPVNAQIANLQALADRIPTTLAAIEADQQARTFAQARFDAFQAQFHNFKPTNQLDVDIARVNTISDAIATELNDPSFTKYQRTPAQTLKAQVDAKLTELEGYRQAELTFANDLLTIETATPETENYNDWKQYKQGLDVIKGPQTPYTTTASQRLDSLKEEATNKLAVLELQAKSQIEEAIKQADTQLTLVEDAIHAIADQPQAEKQSRLTPYLGALDQVKANLAALPQTPAVQVKAKMIDEKVAEIQTVLEGTATTHQTQTPLVITYSPWQRFVDLMKALVLGKTTRIIDVSQQSLRLSTTQQLSYNTTTNAYELTYGPDDLDCKAPATQPGTQTEPATQTQSIDPTTDAGKAQLVKALHVPANAVQVDPTTGEVTVDLSKLPENSTLKDSEGKLNICK